MKPSNLLTWLICTISITFQQQIIYIDSVQNPNGTTYANFNDFINVVSNLTLQPDYYKVCLNINSTLNGVFSLQNLQLEFM